MIKTIVIDDSLEDLGFLLKHLNQISYIDVVKTFQSSIEAFHFLHENRNIDLVISDIDMPELNGIQLMKSLNNKPLLIFISAFPNFALESFEVQPLHFIAKPVEFTQLLKATQRVYETYHSSKVASSDFIFVNINKEFIKINYDDILYLKAEQNYVRIITKVSQFFVLSNLTQFLKQLPSSSFIRIHKSFAIRFMAITKYSSSDVTIKNEILPVSEAYKKQLFQKLEVNTITRVVD